MGSYLLQGIIIGLLFGIPVGAVGTMTIQRTFAGGFKDGLMTGLGSSVADCLYAIVGAFGLTMISDFLLRYQIIINIFGGALVSIMGIRLFLRKDEVIFVQKPVAGDVKMFLSSFAVGITNPAAILTFLFAFSYFGINGNIGTNQGIQLVAGVFVGTYIWWTTLSAFVCFIKRRTENHSFHSMNRVFGTILSLFGAAIFVKTIF